jgi:hypothetical protein
MARTNVPRASIGVNVLNESDYHALMDMGVRGRAACWTFFAIVAACKDKDNGGVIVGPLGIAAGYTRIKTKDIQQAIDLIAEACKSVCEPPWMTYENNTLTIRSFEKWNPKHEGWGGSRCKQDELKMKSSDYIGIGNGDLSEGVKGEIPTELDTTEFRQAWGQWVKHRAEIGKKLRPTSTQQQLSRLKGFGHDRAIAAINHSIANGWQGIHEPTTQTPNRAGHVQPNLSRVAASDGKYANVGAKVDVRPV